jgi:hypothetical protein
MCLPHGPQPLLPAPAAVVADSILLTTLSMFGAVASHSECPCVKVLDALQYPWAHVLQQDVHFGASKSMATSTTPKGMRQLGRAGGTCRQKDMPQAPQGQVLVAYHTTAQAWCLCVDKQSTVWSPVNHLSTLPAMAPVDGSEPHTCCMWCPCDVMLATSDH